MSADIASAAAERLQASLDYRLGHRVDIRPLTPTQVAAVLHALADHTAILGALDYRHDADSPLPAATSLARWFHDVGDRLEHPRIAPSPASTNPKEGS